MSSTKKYAYLLMGPGYDTAAHRACFETPGMHSHIFTVRSLGEATALAARLAAEGFGILELCGAFGAAGAAAVQAAAGPGVGVAYVTRLPGQDALFDAFFGG